MKKFNNHILFGLFTSLLVTIFGIALVYVIKYQPQNLSVSDFIQDLINSNIKKSAILSLSLLTNIPLIYFNQKRKRFKTITGIAIVIGIIAVLIVCAKFNLF
jgi:hypothetical protein